jgi:transcriptional regulator with XRE-family HTH domain
MEPRELLRALMRRDGDNPNSLAGKLRGRVSQPQIQKYLAGTSKEPRRATLMPLAEHFGIPIEAFYDEKVAALSYRQLGLPQSRDGVVVVSDDNDHAAPQYVAEVEVAYLDNHVIPQYRTGGAMGSVGVILRDQPGHINSWNVTREWLAKNVPNITSPQNLAIVTGFGDSMRPLYNPGDPLLVDRGIKRVEYDGIYFFRIEEEGFVKRLQRIPGVGIRAISENKAYEPWDITKAMDFEVFARVVRVWRGTDF